MSDSVIPLRSSSWLNHPLIAGALAAVEAASNPLMISASSHVACRVHFPACLTSLDGEQFFPTSFSPVSDRVQRKACHFLETLLKEEPFLS
ncbi:MAG: hypothetical protein WC612_07525 [Bdellovibrionales bacterium]